VFTEDVSSQCLPLEKSIGNANSHPTATRLPEMSVLGTGHEFQAYRSRRMASRAILFAAHYVESFVQIPINSLDKHGVVVGACKNVTLI
jgi:hypothetical protein